MFFLAHFVFQSRFFALFSNGPLLKSENRLFLLCVFLLMRSGRALILLENKMVIYCKKGTQLFRVPNPKRNKLVSMDDLGIIVPKSVFLLSP